MDNESERVERMLSGPLPSSPQPPLVVGVDMLAARWVSKQYAAVLWLSSPDPDDDYGEDPLEQEIAMFVRTGRKWIADGSGSTGWPWEYGERPSDAGLRLSGFASYDQRAYVTSGVAGSNVTALDVRGNSANLVEVNPVGGFFVIGGTFGEQLLVTPLGPTREVVGASRRLTMDSGATTVREGRLLLRRLDADGFDEEL